MKKIRNHSLFRYWTTRYLATLCIGLLIIAFISIFWIRHTTMEHRLKLTKFLAEEAADRVVDTNGQIMMAPIFPKFLNERERLLNLNSKLQLYIVNRTGDILFAKPNLPNTSRASIPLSILKSEEEIQRLTIGDRKRGQLYAVKASIDYGGETMGWVVILQPKQELVRVQQEYRLLAVMLGSLALLGWVVIYFLSRKISVPIQNVARAASDICEGNYDISLDNDFKEKELYDLVSSFKEMAARLKQLEALRTELLAGVTHELKTPVTSISGMIQALKDEVVTGEEAKEFLQISLKETDRLQKMVGDLLDFNSFAAGTITVHNMEHDMNELVKEISYQWTITQDLAFISVKTSMPDQKLYAYVDPVRIQQIMLNLLNNAKQAIEGSGTIFVLLEEHAEGKLAVHVSDTGSGIPQEEVSLIFERFYRGENKKFKVRGLGLGLPFSKMIAKALGGDLLLKETSSRGTTFTLLLPLIREKR
jgi:signal transduction histidine kinase